MVSLGLCGVHAYDYATLIAPTRAEHGNSSGKWPFSTDSLGNLKLNKTKKTLFLVPSIGGGFMGAAVVMAEIINIKAFQFGHFLIFGAAIGLFVYFIYAGICFATDESNVKHLKLAFLLQVPWFSSPIITYKISAGVELACLLHVSGFNFLYNIGSSFNFSLFNGKSWGIGLNFAALGLYYIASKTTPAR